MEKRTSSDRQSPSSSTHAPHVDAVKAQGQTQEFASDSSPYASSASTQATGGDRVRPRPLSTPSSRKGQVREDSDSSLASEADSYPEVYDRIQIELSVQLLRFLGVHEVSCACDHLGLELVHLQQSKAFAVSGHYSLWEKFKGYVDDCIRKNTTENNHTDAYKVAFGRDSSEKRATSLGSGSHMSSRPKRSDQMRPVSSEENQDSAMLPSQGVPVSDSDVEVEGASASSSSVGSVGKNELQIFDKAEIVVDRDVVLYIGLLQLSDLCGRFELKIAPAQDTDSVKVLGLYKGIADLYQAVYDVLHANSGHRDFVWVFGSRRLETNSGNRRPPRLTANFNGTMAPAEISPATEKSCDLISSRKVGNNTEKDHETADKSPVDQEAGNRPYASAVESRSDGSTKVSEKLQVNKTTVDVIKVKAKNDLEIIESRFKVKIKEERCPNSPETAVLLSLESTNEHSDLERGFEKLRNVCVDIIRQGVSEVKIGLAPDEVALVKRMKQEELRAVLTVNDNVCTLYGLQKDIDEAHTKVKKTLEMSKTSFSPDDSFTFLLPTGQKVTVKKGDIVRQNVDVIVNAANNHLDHRKGVAAAICRAAGGSSFQEECRMLVRKKGEVREGQVVYTGSGLLPFKIIVHAVAPYWSFVNNQSTQHKNFSLLRNACYNSLSVVQQKGAMSVAIPGLGSGIFGFPKDVCAQALMNGTEDFFKKHTTSCIQRVVFVDIDDATVTAFMTEARKRYKLVSGSRPPRVIRDTKPKAEGMLTQLANAGRSLVTPWFGLGNSGSAEMEVRSEELCSICFDRKVNTTLKCNHSFCKTCIDEWAKQKATCPICSRPFGKVTGNQPLGGRMNVSKSYLSLPGYSGCGTIEIKYTIPSGTQGPEHPHPGVYYTGATRVAYLPDNKEGNELLGLLCKAFEARLVFTVGRSVTTSAENVVTWNDIHHKTNMYGGQTGYGYPDPTYLTRLREDLKAKGIE